METKKRPAETLCARCAAPFVCGMQAGEEPCWCTAMPAIKPEPGRGCLCRACLTADVDLQK